MLQHCIQKHKTQAIQQSLLVYPYFAKQAVTIIFPRIFPNELCEFQIPINVPREPRPNHRVINVTLAGLKKNNRHQQKGKFTNRHQVRNNDVH